MTRYEYCVNYYLNYVFYDKFRIILQVLFTVFVIRCYYRSFAQRKCEKDKNIAHFFGFLFYTEHNNNAVVSILSGQSSIYWPKIVFLCYLLNNQ